MNVYKSNKMLRAAPPYSSAFFNPNKRLWLPRKSFSLLARCSTFVGTKPVLKDGTLSFNGNDVIRNVPENVLVTPLTGTSLFVGAESETSSSRHVFKLGVIKDVRLMSLFRFKMWWMIPRVGNSGSDIPVETQMLLLEANEGSNDSDPLYIVFLPVLDGEFRSSLQGTSSNELEFCVESGDPAIVISQSLKAVFVNYGNHPFDLMKESIKILEKQIGNFAHRETKQLPGILDLFGWCTWDAFYHDVNPKGVRDGLKSLHDGGTPAKFLIIDDGWQDTINDFQKEGEPFVEGSQLLSVEENSKFRGTAVTPQSDTSSLKDFVAEIKSNFGVKQFQQALEDSIAANFQDNSIICCMGQSTDTVYHDKPGHHDFNILKRLVLSDGSVLRAKYPGRPSRDCLFSDPVMDGKSLLKIWNLNNCTGVLGVFNCQGAGTWPCLENPVKNDVSPELSGPVYPSDIEYFEEVSGKHWTGDCAVFSFNMGTVFRLAKEESYDITLKILQCDVITVSPIKVYGENIEFAPIGLLNMYNSGGAVKAVVDSVATNSITIQGRGAGKFGAYSSMKPKYLSINAENVEEGFTFDEKDKFLTIRIPSSFTSWDLRICY
ncbi:hypothetical protein ACFE04_030770 [Oxalis oulophora]